MSNPLLRPNDPRFQKADVRDAAGQNRFAEGAGEPAPPSTGDDVFSAGATDEVRPFVPQYDVQQQSRAGLLMILGGIGWAAAVVGGVSLAGWINLGWVGPLLGLVPAGAAGFLAHEELRAISVGAISGESRSLASQAYWEGLTALMACAALVAAMIYRQMNFFPDL